MTIPVTWTKITDMSQPLPVNQWFYIVTRQESNISTEGGYTIGRDCVEEFVFIPEGDEYDILRELLIRDSPEHSDDRDTRKLNACIYISRWFDNNNITTKQDIDLEMFEDYRNQTNRELCYFKKIEITSNFKEMMLSPDEGIRSLCFEMVKKKNNLPDFLEIDSKIVMVKS